MEYRKIINLLENTLNQPSKFRTKKLVEINDDSHGTYNTNSQIKFKTSMLRSCLCNYSDVYILVKGPISIKRVAAPAAVDNDGKEVVFKNWAPFSDCVTEINNTQINNAQNIDIFMPMYNLIEYSHNYTKTSRSLWQYYRDESALTDAGAIENFHVGNNNSASFKFKQKITGVTGANGSKYVEIMVPLKYLSNFWRTIQMTLINCEINLILTWSDKFMLSNNTKTTTLQ